MVSPTAGEQVHRGGGWIGGGGGGGAGWQTGAVTVWVGRGGGVTLPSTQCLKASEEKAVERTDDADGREGVTESVRHCLSKCDRYDCQV